MKRKVLWIIAILAIGILLICLTGCRNNENVNPDENKQENISNSNETSNINEENQEIQVSTTGKLTLENFKNIMEEMGLEVVSNTPEGVNSANHLYTVNANNNSIRYEFNEYKDESVAKNQWNSNVKNSFTEEELIKNEEDQNSNRLESKADNRNFIYFREGNNLLNVVVLDEVGEAELAKVREVFEKLGY